MIAVHFSGHLRTMEQCLPVLKQQLFQPFDQHHFYIHTWDETDRRTKSWYEVPEPPRPVDAAMAERINAELNPVEFVVEKQQFTPQELALEYHGMLKSHESMRKSFQLRVEHHAELHYDFVISVRPDLYLADPIELKNIREAAVHPPFLRSIFAISHYYEPFGDPWISDKYGSRDVLFFGTPATMDHFARIGLDHAIYARHPEQKRTGEVYFDNFLALQGLNLQIVNLIASHRWGMLRPDGKVI